MYCEKPSKGRMAESDRENRRRTSFRRVGERGLCVAIIGRGNAIRGFLLFLFSSFFTPSSSSEFPFVRYANDVMRGVGDGGRWEVVVVGAVGGRCGGRCGV